MKKLFILLFVFSFFQSICYAQTQPVETVTIPKSELTSTQLAKITTEEQLAKVETYGKWVGAGKEVGVAIREALLSVVDVADKFGNTKVGEFTMYMVAWKVMGIDFVRIFLGIIFAMVVTTIIFKSLRKMYPHKILTKGNGFRFWEPKEYQIINGVDYEGVELVKVVYILMLAAAYGITYAIMFS